MLTNTDGPVPSLTNHTLYRSARGEHPAISELLPGTVYVTGCDLSSPSNLFHHLEGLPIHNRHVQIYHDARSALHGHSHAGKTTLTLEEYALLVDSGDFYSATALPHDYVYPQATLSKCSVCYSCPCKELI